MSEERTGDGAISDSRGRADPTPDEGHRMNAQHEAAFIAEIGEQHGQLAATTASEGLAGIRGMGLNIRSQSSVPSRGLAVGVIEPSIDSWNATLMVGHGRTGAIGWELLR